MILWGIPAQFVTDCSSKTVIGSIRDGLYFTSEGIVQMIVVGYSTL